MTTRLLLGDANERIREIPAGSVDLVCCSPPFLALRGYGDSDAEMGSEGTPIAFIEALLALTAQFRRVLAPYGSIAIELGDTYSGSGGGGGDYLPGGLREGQPGFAGSAAAARAVHHEECDLGEDCSCDYLFQRDGNAAHWRAKNKDTGAWPLNKSLAGVPEAFMLSLAYGWNMLDRHGPDSPAGRWRVRNVIVWARPNPSVGQLFDKVRPATSYITVACTSAKRWFDLDAVRTEAQVQMGRAVDGNNIKGSDESSFRFAQRIDSNPAGAPPLDWWEDDDPTGHATMILPTQGFSGTHYAVWPQALAKRLIEMMCPMKVCTTCGEPSRRIVDDGPVLGRGRSNHGHDKQAALDEANVNGRFRPPDNVVRTTLGWTDCGHGTWRLGHVLDPFAGSGTTLQVAQGCGRDATGIELYEANVELIRGRLGMFLDEVVPM